MLRGCRIRRMLACIFLVSGRISNAATHVDLVIDEPYATRNVSWPVTTGVPVPRGALASAAHCRLLNDLDQEHPLQARVAATWDAAGSSVCWLTIDFIAYPRRRYRLELGPEIRARNRDTKLQVTTRHTEESRGSPTQEADVRVETGPLSVEFSAESDSSLKAIRLDVDGDPSTSSELIAFGPDFGEHGYRDLDGNFWSSARGTPAWMSPSAHSKPSIPHASLPRRTRYHSTNAPHFCFASTATRTRNRRWPTATLSLAPSTKRSR